MRVLLMILLPSLAAASPAPVTVRMDPRIELLSAVMMLGEADRIAQGFYLRGSAYEAAMRRHFAAHGGHPAVRRYRELAVKTLDTDTAYSAAMFHTPPPELQPKRALLSYHYAAFGGGEPIAEFFDLLRAFARDADFAGFWRDAARLRGEIEEDVRAQVARFDAAGPFARYSGRPFAARYGFVLSPFAKGVGSATWPAGPVRAPTHLEALLGPNALKAGRLVFHYDWRMRDVWLQAAKEFLEGQLTAEQLDASAALYPPLRGCGRDWRVCARNQMAVAVMGRLLALEGFESAVWELPHKYRRFGMPQVGRLMRRLEKYEADRRRWPTLADFVPELVDELAAAAAEGGSSADFSGNLASLDGGESMVIVPRGWSKSEAALRSRASPGVRAHADDFSGAVVGMAIVAVGCADSNAWLKRRWKDLHLPLAPSAKRQVIRRQMTEEEYVFAGDLRVATVARNPDSPAHGAAVYCARGDAEAAWLLAQDLGPWDFRIYQGTVSVKSGMYEKTRNPWRIQ